MGDLSQILDLIIFENFSPCKWPDEPKQMIHSTHASAMYRLCLCVCVCGGGGGKISKF